MKFNTANWNFSLLDNGTEELVHLEIGPSPEDSPWLTMNLTEEDARGLARSMDHWADRLQDKKKAQYWANRVRDREEKR